jgi:hypothetical protein
MARPKRPVFSRITIHKIILMLNLYFEGVWGALLGAAGRAQALTDEEAVGICR